MGRGVDKAIVESGFKMCEKDRGKYCEGMVGFLVGWTGQDLCWDLAVCEWLWLRCCDVVVALISSNCHSNLFPHL